MTEILLIPSTIWNIMSKFKISDTICINSVDFKVLNKGTLPKEKVNKKLWKMWTTLAEISLYILTTICKHIDTKQMSWSDVWPGTWLSFYTGETPLLMKKRTVCHMHPMKTQITLRIRTGWSVFIFAWWNLHPWLSKMRQDSDQTARMRKLIWIFAGRTCPKVRFLTLLLKYKMNTVKERCYVHWSRETCSAHRDTRFAILIERYLILV